MESVVTAISFGVIVGIIYYIFRNRPPGGGFRGGFA